jgi:hypothetical protein
MLKEALAANTIGGKADDNIHKRAAVDEARQLQVEWARIGVVPEDARRALADRFRRACRQVVERADGGRAAGRAPGYLVAGSSGRPGGAGADPAR